MKMNEKVDSGGVHTVDEDFSVSDSVVALNLNKEQLPIYEKIKSNCEELDVKDDLYFNDGLGNETVVLRGNSNDKDVKEAVDNRSSVDLITIEDDFVKTNCVDDKGLESVCPLKLDDSVINNNDISIIEKTECVNAQRKYGRDSTEMLGGMRHLVTSTPFKHRQTKDDSTICAGSVYTTPARIMLQKWKPECLARNHDKTNQNLQLTVNAEDLSEIEKLKEDNVEKNLSKRGSHVNGNNEFEDAFRSLYATLFEQTEGAQIHDNVVSVIDCNKTINKLEIYHNDILEQNKRNSEMFDGILSEITSSKHLITLDEYVCRTANELSTISEESDMELVSNDKTEICVPDKTLVAECNRNDIPEATGSTNTNEENKTESNNAEESSDGNLDTRKPAEAEDIVPMVDMRKSSSVLVETIDIKSSDDDFDIKLDLTQLETAPVKDRSLSIIYLNKKELTLDEEIALLISDEEYDEDEISLHCSDIGTPRSSDSAVIAIKVEEPLEPPPLRSDSKESASPLVYETEDKELPPVSNELGVEGQSKDEQTVKPGASRFSEIFVSSDPKENADNDDPEWNHLKWLKTDKDRYKALRERWRSVIIPNPNIDLTCQNYRRRRCVVPLIIKSEQTKSFIKEEKKNLKRPYPEFDNEDTLEPAIKKRKCVTFFEDTIKSLLKKLEFKRFCLFKEMDDELNKLVQKQEEDINMCRMRAYSHYGLMEHLQILSNIHTDQIHELRNLYTKQIERAEKETADYVKTLNGATDEVYTFYKFYEDLDTKSEQRCTLFVTNQQFNEIVQTERMLDLYGKFYPNF